MNPLNLKPSSAAIKQYFSMMGEKRQMGLLVEGNVAPAFADLLGYCARQAGYKFNEQHHLKLPNKRHIRLDGAVLTHFNLRYGAWEAKDSQDDLRVEIKKKFEAGYPRDNILFQSPELAILVQDGREVLAASLDENQPQALVDILQAFFGYRKPAYDAWEQAVAEFKDRVPEVAKGLDDLIEREYSRNRAYKEAFDRFFDLCRNAINPNLSKDAVEEMLIQHILTERIFRRVFQNDKFTRQNAIAREIETVVDALTSKVFNRDDFTRGLDHFYGAIETTAATISDYNEKQDFLNTVYEQFFQGFSVKVADTHGIVYTPQAIVQFMVKSVEELLRREFNRSLADSGVHILDPFVGTGNFILRVMEEIRQTRPSALAHKYTHELHCNEIMLLPYYIASMNIEHAYYEAAGEYAAFEGICLVDTFELAESQQLPMFVEANSARVQRQRQTDLTVIVGNPPYNVGQINENDNNKNRKYAVIDRRVQETYARASMATNRNALSDPYVKAFRWASDRIKEEGVIAYISNNSFIDNIAFDGMRQHLLADFDAVYVLDLGGNVRKNPKLSGTTHNVFGIQVGVCITFLVRRRLAEGQTRQGKLYYARMDEWWRKGEKYQQLEQWEMLDRVGWQTLTPTAKNVWLSEGLQTDWDDFLPLGTKEAKAGQGQAIFELYSNGVKTNRDTVVYDYNTEQLEERVRAMIEAYNVEVDRYQRAGRPKDIDQFVKSDVVNWSRDLKLDLQRGHYAEFDHAKIRASLYRPFTKESLFFDSILNEEVYQFPRIFPTPKTERENRVICLTANGSEKPFMVLMSDAIPDLHLVGAGSGAQCFPLYTYEWQETGVYTRRENISDWALAQYRQHYGDETITKEDIFYHLYALLHHPAYRERYAANLKRELPRVPFVALTPRPPLPQGEGEAGRASFRLSGEGEAGLASVPLQGEGEETPFLYEVGEGQGMGDGFHALAGLGRKLAELHLGYESLPEYPLQRRENPAVPPSLRVEKMALSRDKTALRVNDFLTLEGIPAEAFGYRLGNRSALEWVIEQYRVTTDARSGITNDPNRLDDEGYIARLVGQVIQVSVETQKLVAEIAGWEMEGTGE